PLHPIELPTLAPVGDGGHVDVEEGSRSTSTIAAIAPLARGTRTRTTRTAILNVVDIPDPLDFARGEVPPIATAKALGVELRGDLLIGLSPGEFAHAGDDR